MIPTIRVNHGLVLAGGDWHIGSKSHAKALFQRHLARAVRERWALLHIGDALEMVTPTSKVAMAGALRDQDQDPESQRQALVAILKQFRSPGFILPGNHEFRIDAKTGLDFMALVTDAGGPIRPLAEPGIVRIRVGSQTCHALLHHGEGPAVSPTTLFDRLQRDYAGVDVILAGHIHAATLDPAETISPDGPRTVLRLRVGHYLNRPPYALRRPIARLAPCGSWLLRFSASTHDVRAEWLG